MNEPAFVTTLKENTLKWVDFEGPAHFYHSAAEKCDIRDIPMHTACYLACKGAWNYVPITLTHVACEAWSKYRSLDPVKLEKTNYVDTRLWKDSKDMPHELPIVGYVDGCSLCHPKWKMWSVVTCKISITYYNWWVNRISNRVDIDGFRFQRMPVSIQHLVKMQEGAYAPIEVAIVARPARNGCEIFPVDMPAATIPTGFLSDCRTDMSWRWEETIR